MDDPRSSNDPNLKAALKAWDETSRFRDKSFDDAMRIRTALYNTASHRAYGWAAMTCGRIAAYREELDLAEVLLTEAIGRFALVGDKYGEGLALSHLAIPQVYRQNLNQALELAVKPLSSSVTFQDRDADLLHNVAAQCYWARDEFHPALLHLMKVYDLVKNTNAYDRRSVVLGNIGAVLLELGENELGLSASTEAWRLALEHCIDKSEIRLSALANMVRANCELEDYGTALCHAEILLEHLALTTAPLSFMFGFLCEAFALNGYIEKAQYCLDRSRSLGQKNLTPGSSAMLEVARGTLLEAKQSYKAAIGVAKKIIDHPVASVGNGSHRAAAMVLSRSYAALGRRNESAKWKTFATETGREKFLGNILSNQIRASLKVEQPTDPLTDQELNCLNLSAHGQTSADIAVKLDIKTRTVNFHFTNILRKLNAMNRQEAIAKASEANLLRRT
jgi:DNA-binding CsgD family transcriptional regulator/tetratricopeptide (TPR) repeat protein